MDLGSQVEVKDEQLAGLSEELKDAHDKCQYFEQEVCAGPRAVPRR